MTTQINLRHSDNLTNVSIYELQNGDFIWNHGFLFEVHDAHVDDGVLRYTGKIVKGVESNDSLLNTGFDGSTYGHNDSVQCLIVKRELLTTK